MDLAEEMHPDVRPKRQFRRPVRLQDYEVDYVGYQPRDLPQWSSPPPLRTLAPLQEDPAQMSFFQPPQAPSESFMENAAHSETPQLAPSCFQRRNRGWETLSAPTRSYQAGAHHGPHFSAEIRAIQEENAKLLQSQQWIQSGLKDLHEARSEIKELINVARTLKSEIAQSHSPAQHLRVEVPQISFPKLEPQEESDWPDPPPWPEPEEDLQQDMKQLKIEGASNQAYYSFRDSDNSPQWPPPPPPHIPLAAASVNTKQSFFQPTQPPSPAMRAAPRIQPANPHMPPAVPEQLYRGPQPTIPKFTNPDPSEFARLRIALENLLPANTTELFRYQVLVDHLKLEEARLIADAYLNSPTPYTDTLAALHDKFGQPHQLALRKIASVLDAPEVKRGDIAAFQKFALQIQSLVGLLQTLGPEVEVELNCGSHVARLLSKLPPEQRADFRRHQFKQAGTSHTLIDLSEWLRYESWCQGFDNQTTPKTSRDRPSMKNETRTAKQSVMVLHGAGESKPTLSSKAGYMKEKFKSKVYCAYCDSDEHYLSQCGEVAKLSKEQLKDWIQVNRRCWRCARTHLAAQCTLKKPCSLCHGKHLLPLHEINAKTERVSHEVAKQESCLTSSASNTLYLDRPGAGSRVMLKVVPILIHYGGRTLSAFAILDDGSERSMLLPTAAKALGIKGTPEDLPLRTVRQDIQVLHGYAVTFHISSVARPHTSYKIEGAFTANRLSLAQHTYPIERLQKKFSHLRGLPIPALRDAEPFLLIGSDQPHLITPIEPVRLGPPGSPAAVHTRLGWTLQGPVHLTGRPTNAVQCLFTSSPPKFEELYKHVERLWQMDTVPYRPEKEVVRSKQDQQAVDMLEANTIRTEVNGINRYATPLLRHPDMPLLAAPKDSVLALLRSTERRLLRNPEQAEVYKKEIKKLIDAGAVKEVPQETFHQEEWYIPHHLVSHNGKSRLVFNCSHEYHGQSLNQFLLPGPTLGASLLGVLLRFREHPIAVSGDIKGMFHQVRLLPGDRPLLKFLWRDLRVDEPPRVFEWQVLPFGTTCSPCCATYALQRLVADQSHPIEDLKFSVENCFYVDNCLQSLDSSEEAKSLVDRLRALLASAGFDLRQWACNDASVLSHLPQDARSESLELWLAQDKSDPQESTLGLSWNWETDTLGYKHRSVTYEKPTLRNIYKVLASQYDPLGYLLPYTTRAKLIIRQLWDKKRGWDDSNLPSELLQAWTSWEAELQFLPLLSLPRPYVPVSTTSGETTHQVHIFADASEQAYGAVAYLRTQDSNGEVHLSFILARSRVAPKRVQSIPRLELCAALTAAQLAHVLEKELTRTVNQMVLWSDSTTVLTWLQSQSCRYKVFVGGRVAEIQELTKNGTWRYVDSVNNPADDLTRGKPLRALTEHNRWSQGPPFLLQDPDTWPERPSTEPQEDSTELRKTAYCGLAVTSPSSQNATVYKTWQECIEAKVHALHASSPSDSPPIAEEYHQAEKLVIQQAQQESFPEDYKLLAAGKSVSSSSRLLTLSPELDQSSGLIRVGGRLRRLEGLSDLTLHPIVLDPTHPVTLLLIKRYDQDLHHPGPERVFAELRRSFWILRGREAIRKYQHTCVECRRWRARPAIPKMADLPAARLRIFKPAFYSTGVDCFGPMLVKVARRHEKRWGIIFKCLTTRAVHLDLLRSMDVDAYLMALRRFIARRGTPAEIWSDRGTNFKGGERELKEAFTSMEPALQQQLAQQKIRFHFNPPAAPHFGGVWEREIRSVKTALYTSVGAQPVYEEVLLTVLLEVEMILNSKPLGYVFADVADIDPVTPNSLLMGRPDGSLPQVVYPDTEILSQRRWRHSQVLADHFWARFLREYLPTLQTRQKWHSATPELYMGAVIMLVDSQLPRASWPIGRVKIHQSDDGHIRSADVEINGHVYTRPVARLVLLPALPSGED
ncbi:SH3 and multiple ankyrin repeat domains protein 2 isoform X1 [Oryzias latipes]|uniref:SH3 and multiple ankyrin repeat domains protein 2 isoform X1 n=1 Tax=Oryzias latipes TaxID=8090 RepID=UPI000CE23CB8|nr:SH3 and multiple ankyrin repeat domains protein 2 isoform X1 [Oryzias latipes]